ncbi:MAG: peptidoglycan-binding protein [Kiloniellales bacterium]
MRLFLLLLGLIPLLALGVDLYFKERAQERDARLVATANRLLIQTTAPSQAARTVEIRRIAEAEPGLWQVQGYITLEEAGQEQRSAYSVEIEQRCGDLQDDACWRPHALIIGEEQLLDESTTPIAEAAPAPAAPRDIGPAPTQTSTADTAVIADATERPAPTADSQPVGVFVAAIPDEPAATLDGSGAQAMPKDLATSGGTGRAAAPAIGDSDSREGRGAALETVEMSVEESLIWLIQDRLARLGYGEAGSLQTSGVLDVPTKAAIEAYQFAHGLERDGVPSFELLDRIQAEATQPRGPAAANAAQPADGQQMGNQVLSPGSTAPAVPLPAQTATTQAAATQSAEALSAQVPPTPTVVTAEEPVQVAANEPTVQMEATVEAGTETAAAETAAPSWDTTGATGITATALAELEEQVAPAASDSLEAESDETLPDAQGDAEMGPAELEPAPGPAAAPQQARIPETGDAAATPEAPPAPTVADDSEETESADESLVFLIQDRLNRLGYDKPTPITLNGRMGSRTRLAIFDYQQKHRLPKDGKPSEALLRHLETTLLGQRSGATANSD